MEKSIDFDGQPPSDEEGDEEVEQAEDQDHTLQDWKVAKKDQDDPEEEDSSTESTDETDTQD